MNHKQIIEKILNMHLTEKHMQKIEYGWNAFYKEPLRYKDSIVVDMVKLDIQEV